MAQSIEEVLTKLQEKIQLQATRSGGSINTNEKKPDYVCEKCQDRTGFIVVNDGVEYWRDCSCLSWRKSERIIKSSEITDQFKSIGFGSFITEGKPQVISDMYECAIGYYKSFDEVRNTRRNGAALLGQPGAGKTHLLMAVANNLMQKKGVPVLYFPYVEGFNDLKDDFDKLEEKLERMKRVDVLFIDDLFKPAKGKPRATDWQVEQTYAVINHRYLNHKPILISSELTVDQLCDVDEALGTRIYEMCKDFTVVVQGDRKQLNHRLED